MEMYTEPGDLESVRKALEARRRQDRERETALIAKQTIAVDVSKARSVLRLVENLEDNDDVQRVTSNMEICEELLAEVAG